LGWGASLAKALAVIVAIPSVSMYPSGAPFLIRGG